MATMDLERIAYHEAGHAVAHIRLNVLQNMASIKPKDGNLGNVSAEGIEHVWKPEEARPQVLCYCAGYAALVATGCSDEVAKQGADDDFENATELIDTWGLSGTLEEWQGQAVELMSGPDNIRAVDSVDKALMKYETLDADYMDVLVDHADGNVTKEEWDRYLLMAHPEMLKQESE